MAFLVGCTSVPNQELTSTSNSQSSTSTPGISSTPSPTLTLSPAITPTPTLAYPYFPAPTIPEVSADISVENVGRLTRLTSLGEGDMLGVLTSPDGKWVAINSSNGILILDAKTLKRALFLPTSMTPTSVSFIDNSTKITARDCDQGYIWSLPDGKELKHSVFFIENPGWLSYWGCKATIDKNWEYAFVKKTDIREPGLYQVATGNAIYTLDYDPINVAFAPDNSLIALTTPAQINILQFQDGKLVWEIPEPGVKWLFFSPDGKMLATVLEDQTKFWNTNDFSLLFSVRGTGLGNNYLEYPFYSPDGSILVFKKDNTYRLVKGVDGTYINSVSGYGLKFSEDSQSLTVDNGSGQVSIYHVSEDRSTINLIQTASGMGLGAGYNSRQLSIPGVLSPDGSKLLLVKLVYKKYMDTISEFTIYDFMANTITHIPVDKIGYEVLDAVWLPDQQTFGALLQEGSYFGDRFVVLDLNSKSFVSLIGEYSPADKAYVGFNPDDSNEMGFLKGDLEFRWELKDNYYYYNQVDPDNFYFPELKEATSLDGKYHVTLSKKDNPGYREYVLVSINGTIRDEFTGFSNLDFAFSPDSKLIAISTFTMLNGINVSIFNIETGEKLFTTGDYFADGDYAPKVKFSPDGKYFVILTQQGYPQIWGIP